MFLSTLCRRCLMPPWKTGSWALNPPLAPPCSCTGLWEWSMSSTLLLSSSYWERLDSKASFYIYCCFSSCNIRRKLSFSLSGVEARSAVVSQKPQRSGFQPGAGDDPPAHLQTPAEVHPLGGGVRLHRAAHAVAADQANQTPAAHLPALQCHALQVTQIGNRQWIDSVLVRLVLDPVHFSPPPSAMLQSASCLWSSCYSRLFFRLYWSKGTLASGSKAWFGPGQSVLGIYCKSLFVPKFPQFVSLSRSLSSFKQTYLHVRRDLHSYLLGEQEDNEANQPVNNNNNNNPPPGHHNNNNNPAPAVGEGLHAAHQAILQQGGPVGFQPYHRPLRFPFRVRESSCYIKTRTRMFWLWQRRPEAEPGFFFLKNMSSQIVLLIAFLCITLLVASLVCLTLPGETWQHSFQHAFTTKCMSDLICGWITLTWMVTCFF